MKSICMLLNGKVRSDSRVIKTIKSLSSVCKVDLYYINGNSDDKDIFNSNVRVFSYNKIDSLKSKIQKHSYFYNEYLFFVDFVISKNCKYDFIFSNDLPTLKPASILKSKIGGKLIYDSHEIYIETINQFFPKKTSGIKKILFNFLINFMRTRGEAIERKLLKEVDYFITVCESLKTYFEGKYGFKGIKVVMNCPNKLPPISPNEIIDLKEKFGFQKQDFLLLFQGNLGPGKDVDMIIEAMQFVDSDIRLGILGGGTLKSQLVNQVKELKLSEKVRFLDRVPSTDLYKYTKSADAGITLKDNGINLNKKLGIATKFFEYIHAGIPLVSTRSIEIEIIANKYDICILVDRKIDEIVNGINQLKLVNREEQAEKTAKASEVYNWQNQEVALLEIVK
jgi:glycosyltransferase involved in cell wall biosynthesis